MRNWKALGALAGLLGALGGAEAAQAQPPGWRAVKMPLIAEPLPPEAYGERQVRPDEVFMVQRLSAVQSATLLADVTVPGTAGEASLPKGSQLFLALDPKGTKYWCGAYRPRRASEFMGIQKVQWVCLEDADHDQTFETFYTTPLNAGSFLPSFDRIQGPRPIEAGAVAYVLDDQADRAYFETAVAWQKTFNIYNRLFFWTKARRGSEGEWSDATSSTAGVLGGYVSVGGKPPIPVNAGGATFSVTERGSDVVKVRPESVVTGVLTYGITSGLGRR